MAINSTDTKVLVFLWKMHLLFILVNAWNEEVLDFLPCLIDLFPTCLLPKFYKVFLYVLTNNINLRMDTSTDENLMKIACESNLLWSQWTKIWKNLIFQKKNRDVTDFSKWDFLGIVVHRVIFQNETFLDFLHTVLVSSWFWRVFQQWVKQSSHTAYHDCVSFSEVKREEVTEIFPVGHSTLENGWLLFSSKTIFSTLLLRFFYQVKAVQ